MSEPQRTPAIADEAPSPDYITDYDRRHFATYLCLLYAAGEGQSDEEISRNILEIDPNCEPDRARRTLHSHLNRARWLAESGYQTLLET